MTKPTMDKEIRAEWLKRLRSGEYKQGRATLKAEYADGVVKFCCLGVLCEIAAEQGVIERTTERTREVVFTSYDGDSAGLTGDVLSWACIEGMDALGRLSGGVISLSGMNDSGGRTFCEIADVIEEKVEGV